jgi:hypothetical protein
MVSWGLEVNDYGNAILDGNGGFIKLKDRGMTDGLWAEMVAYADSKGYKKGDYKSLNLPFENRLLSQPREIRERMVAGVEAFAYNMMQNVLNSSGSAAFAVEAILKADSFDLGAKAKRIEDPAEWTGAGMAAKAASLNPDKGPAGHFDD